MRDHDEVVKNILRKTEQYEKERREKKCGRKKILRATAGILAVFTVVIVVFGVIRAHWNGENEIKKSVPSVTNHPTVTSEALNSIPRTTETPDVKSPRPSNLYMNIPTEEIALLEDGEDEPDMSEIKMTSISLQRAIEETQAEDVYFPVRISLFVEGHLIEDSSIVDSEIVWLEKQGIFVDNKDSSGVDVLINKKQIEELRPSDICGYLLGWTKKSE
ncbi:MAG: hypothetical protein II134_00840 [Lachnospiraceae bacterium]|nr:hypothetical protein [Lachnospiraceae bacterium]